MCRSNTDHVRTVEFTAQVEAEQVGRTHRWFIKGFALMRLPT